jgi:serine/threonine protein kinase
MSDHSQILFQAPEIDDLAPLFPTYHIESLIAIGGMGAVYKAVQKSLDRPVAIKILPQEFSRDPNFCTGFEAEAKSMACLNHPNLIGVYDFGEVNGMLFIIMEYVAGQSLFHYAHGHRLAQDDVIQLMVGVCQGLAHAHENGIVHRDIKPSNVLLDQNKEPKIGDFGLARPVGKDHVPGAQIYGTPGYTAPEVINAPLSVNHRADIFSIGVLIHELITGRLPADDPRRASLIVGCDPRFDEIIRRATDPSPELRYPNAHLLLGEILKIQQPIVATPPSAHVAPPPAFAARPTPRLVAAAPVVKKSSGIFSSSGLAMLALAAVLGFLFYKHNASKPIASLSEPAPKPAPTQASTPPPTPLPDPTTALEPAPKPSIDPIPTPVPLPAAEGHPEAPPKPETFDTKPPEAVVEKPIQPALPTTNSPAPASATSFDTVAFLVTVQDRMKSNNERLTEEYQEALAKNLENFGRGIKRAIRDIPNRQIRPLVERDLEQFLELAQKNGGRIPEDLDSQFSDLEDVNGDHAKHLTKQDALDKEMLEEIEPIRESYISGLERKRASLIEKRDEVAAEEITKEIDLTRSDAGHFQQILGCEVPDVGELNERETRDKWDQQDE